MDEATQPLTSHSSLPLISRLDQLEFIMKYLERKQRYGCGEKQCEPLDLGVKDTYLKGSLSDRVAYLEQRLFQLCVEMDSRSSSYPMSLASTQGSGSGESSSTQSTKTEEICHSISSFPTFNYNHLPTPQPQLPHLHFQEKSMRVVEQEMKNRSGDKKEEVKNRSEKKKSKEDAKKRVATPWPHLKLLGC
ncbi:uncharacterized protein G2W53_036242 [Senna tora]|uniref:Uncharacterized protein n=1 Tax=Senna tora TaxID=362788 RepID=A0A834ST37_9FABA|nr:uncharacterized protein G2W53_036242 [Senna tora]